MGCRLRIGLTGGIGSGKSEASRLFEHLGATVIDTDLIARELVEPGQPALSEIVHAFGADVLDEEGVLDRARLREKAFSSSDQRKKLEAILHPRIRECRQESVERRKVGRRFQQPMAPGPLPLQQPKLRVVFVVHRRQLGG